MPIQPLSLLFDWSKVSCISDQCDSLSGLIVIVFVSPQDELYIVFGFDSIRWSQTTYFFSSLCPLSLGFPTGVSAINLDLIIADWWDPCLPRFGLSQNAMPPLHATYCMQDGSWQHHHHHYSSCPHYYECRSVPFDAPCSRRCDRSSTSRSRWCGMILTLPPLARSLLSRICLFVVFLLTMILVA